MFKSYRRLFRKIVLHASRTSIPFSWTVRTYSGSLGALRASIEVTSPFPFEDHEHLRRLMDWRVKGS